MKKRSGRFEGLKQRTTRLAVAAAVLLVGCSTQTPLFSNFSSPNGNGAVQGFGVQQLNLENSFMRNRAMVRTGNTVVKVAYQNKAQLNQLIGDLGMDVWTTTPQFAVGQVDPETLSRLRQSRLKMELLTQEGFTPRNNFDPQYHTYEETLAALKAMVAKYPNLAKLNDIGDGWEKTKGLSDRDLWSVRISGAGDPDKKPGIAFFGNHHARELVTVEIPLNLIQLLLEGYGKDPQITQLVDSRDIWITPMVNPDGHVRAEKGENWRKNNNDNKAFGGKYRGVDLNRNYGFKWNTGGSSSSPSSDTFHGGTPFSEPETQSVRDFLRARKNVKIMMSYHSFSNLILWPWGHTEERVPDNRLREVGNKLGEITGYKPEQASDLYVASGITDDFSYGELGMLSFTTEIGSWGDGFDPPYSKVAQFWKENKPAALYLIDLAGKL